MNLYMNDKLIFGQTSEYLALNDENDYFNLLMFPINFRPLLCRVIETIQTLRPQIFHYVHELNALKVTNTMNIKQKP